MIPTQIGFTRDEIIDYILEDLFQDEIENHGMEGARLLLTEETNERLVDRVVGGGSFEDETECAGIFDGAYPAGVVDFFTVSDVTGIPVSLEQYLQDKDLEAEDD